MAFVSDDITSATCDGDVVVVTRTYSVTDCSGNSINVYQTINVDDTQNPTASNPLPQNVQCFSDIVAPNPAVVTDEADNCDGTVTVAFVSDDVLSATCDGDVVVVTRTYSVTDCSGNSINVYQTINVDDTQAPTADVLAPISVQCFSDIPAANIADVTGEADNCDGAVTVSIVGDNVTSALCDGATVVVARTYRLTDCSGNFADITQTINVDDTQAPTVLTQPFTVYLNSLGAGTITVANINYGSSDNCDGTLNYSLNKTTFSCSDVPGVTVTLTVTDCSGNSASNTAFVTVIDDVLPVITCKPGSPFSRYVDEYQTYYTVVGAEFNATATDACGIQSLTYACATASVTSGNSLAGVKLLGVQEHTVVWTAVDVNGNISGCTTKVTVNKRTTTLTYTGETAKNYYGVVALSATLKDVLNANVAGKTITFTIGTQSTTAVTNASGVASTTLPLTQVPGSYTVATSFTTDASYIGSSDSDLFTINQATTALTLTLSGYQVRFMDNLTYTAVVKPENNGNALTGSVTFKVMQGLTVITSYIANVVPIPGSPDGSVQAMVINQLPASVVPGSYTVTAMFTSTNTNYSNSNTDSKTLKVDPKDASPYNATGFYVGDGFAWTTGPSTSTATLTMVAAIRDANTPAGDVRGAKVSFYFVNGTTLTAIPSAQNLPVGLVNPSDGSVGTASAIVQLNIGSLNSNSFQIAIKVTGGYTNNPWDALSQTIVTVSKPVTGGFITGGSNFTNSNSSGYIKGASGLNTDFQFDIQYTKSGTNPKGKVTVMVRSYYDRNGILDSKLHTYFIKTNAIALLAISNPLATGTFSAKANMEELLLDGTTASLESGATFQMVAFQNACKQQIAITYYRKAGGVWFASNWDALTAKSILQNVNPGSQVYVSGGGNCSVGAPLTKSADIATAIIPVAVEKADLKVYPNPFTDRLRFEFVSPESVIARIDLYDMTGRMVKTIFEQPIEGGVSYEAGFKPEAIISGMYIYRVTMGEAVYNGKVVFKKE